MRDGDHFHQSEVRSLRSVASAKSAQQLAEHDLIRPAVEITMERYVHNANITFYRRLIAESELDASRDENRHKTLFRLLAEELAKDKLPKGNDPSG